MSFKFVTSDTQGNVYAVTDSGDLLYYRDEARNGASQWSFGGVGQKIGSGWGHFLNVFAGEDGIIYAIAPNGNLLYFRDEARNGTAQWSFGGIGQKIGSGWLAYRKVFSGGDGIIYALTASGDLFFYRDEARDGTSRWSFGGAGQKINQGWKDFLHVFSGGAGVIYAAAQNGDLLYFQDKARDGTRRWFAGGKGRKIASGWNFYSMVFSGGDGIIYAIASDGSLLFFKDEARNGKARWAFDGKAQAIGSGWLIAPSDAINIQGYCLPPSVSPGGAVQFKVSSTHDYQVTYLRLKSQSDGLGIPMMKPFGMNADPQDVPTEAWRDGCGWRTSFVMQVPADWPSGIYTARCADLNGDEAYIVFVVKPGANQNHDFAVLANTNTWNAYNDFGGFSKYSSPPAAQLSFERPNPYTTPVDDGQINHLTRAELWILNWLEDSGFSADVYSDRDFNDGIDGLASYKALILSTHPEYWTLQMMDNLGEYLQQGGSVLYLAGNGLFERVEYSNESNSLILLNGDPNSDRPLGYFRNLNPPQPEREILGVAYRFDNFMTFAAFSVDMSDHRFFAGTGLADGDLIGQEGINGGAASGWEMDTSEAGGAPDGATVSATGADDRGSAPANVEVLAHGVNPGYGAHMTCYETGQGGVVFSASSLSFGGSLVKDAQLQAVIKNVLNECLSR